ncbi:MAG: caspase family protein [Vulcanimicrobiota bacterium]
MNILRYLSLALLFTTLALPGVARADELELVLQSGHARNTRDVVWLDDIRVATCSEDGSLKVWDTRQERVKRTMWMPANEENQEAWGKPVTALEKTDAGLWALEQSGRLYLWDPDSGKLLKTVELPERYQTSGLQLAADRQGDLYVYGVTDEVLRVSDGQISVVKTPAKFDLLCLQGPNGMVAANSEGLMYGSLEAPVKLPESPYNRWGVKDLLLSPDGKTAFVATTVNWLEAWDLETEALLFRAPVNENAVDEEMLKGPGMSGNDLGFKLAFLEGSLVAATAGGELTLIDAESGAVSPLLHFQKYGINTISVNPSQTALAGAYGSTGEIAVPLAVRQGENWKTSFLGGRGLSFTELLERDNTLFLSAGSNFVLSYDLSTGQPKHSFSTGYFPLICLGQNVLYAGGNDGILHAFDTRTGTHLWEKKFSQGGARYGEGITALSLSPDGRELAVGTLERYPHLFIVEAGTGAQKQEISIDKTAQSLTYSQDGRKLFLSDADKVSLYDLGYHKIIHSWKKPTARIDHFVTLMNHPSRDSLLGLSKYGKLVEFDPARLDLEPAVKDVLPRGTAHAMKADGANLLIAANQRAYLMDVQGKILKTYGDHLSSCLDVLALDEVVLTTAYDSQVILWNKQNPEKLATLLTLDEGENWLCIASDFHFDGTQEAQNLIEWRWNGELFELSRFFEKFYQPGLLARTIKPASRASAAVSGPTLGTPPPRVKILPPKQLEGGFYQISLEPEAPLAQDAEVRLYHNGHRVAGSSPFKVKAVAGENRLRASAFNSDRSVESDPDRHTFQGQTTSIEKTLHVFAAAVNDYPNRLDFAVQDAQSFVKAFEPGLYNKVNKVTLYDQEANKESIVKALSAIECEPQDTLLVFLAGHGTIIDNRFHFIPHGADGKVSSQALSSAELGKILSHLPATRQVLFLDTCHAGASAKDLAELLVEKETPLIASEQGSMLIKDQKVLARQAGTFLVAGSTPDATAAEIPELGHGLFTYAVLNGLQGELGRDHEVTVNQLLTYLSEKVPELSMKFRGSRQGIWQFSAGQDFPIAKPAGTSE